MIHHNSITDYVHFAIILSFQTDVANLISAAQTAEDYVINNAVGLVTAVS